MQILFGIRHKLIYPYQFTFILKERKYVHKESKRSVDSGLLLIEI